MYASSFIRTATIKGRRRAHFPIFLAVLWICLAVAIPAPAQESEPAFKGPPLGGSAFNPACKVQGLAIQGGVLDLVSPEGRFRRESVKQHGIATALVTREPFSTELNFLVAAVGETALHAKDKLARREEALTAAIFQSGVAVMDVRSKPVPNNRGGKVSDDAPIRVASVVTLLLVGEVDPLAAVSALPPDSVSALLNVRYKFADTVALPEAMKEQLGKEAWSDAAERARLRGGGAQIGKRIDLEFSGVDRVSGLHLANRRTVEVAAVVTYAVSFPPGASGFSD